MPGFNKKRTTEEYIILSLSGVTSLSILPFAIIRILAADWGVAILDTVAVLVTATLFFYVYRSSETRKSGALLALICMVVITLTIELKGSAQLPWVYPALSAIFFLLPAHLAALLTVTFLLLVGTVVWPQISAFSAIQFFVSAAATLLFSYVFAHRMRIQASQLTSLATKDPLTGAGNRRAMEQRLGELAVINRLNKVNINSLILMDLDKFKKINDVYGHTVGDDILVKFTQLIKSRIRSTDSLYRFGGEEFVVLADNTNLIEAAKLAEQLRSEVEQCKYLSQYKVTISLGTAQYKGDETGYEWLGRADKAMYQAKEAGRNLSCVA